MCLYPFKLTFFKCCPIVSVTAFRIPVTFKIAEQLAVNFPELNLSQVKAIREALKKQFTLIQGPPGNSLSTEELQFLNLWSLHLNKVIAYTVMIVIYSLLRYRKNYCWSSPCLLVFQAKPICPNQCNYC